VPHPSSLTTWRRRLGPAGIAAVTAAVVHRLQTEKVVRGRRFAATPRWWTRIFTTPPIRGSSRTGSGASRVARQVQGALPAAGPQSRDRARAVKPRILAIGKLLRRRTGDAVTQVRQMTEELARLGEAQLRTVHRVAAAVDAAWGRRGRRFPRRSAGRRHA